MAVQISLTSLTAVMKPWPSLLRAGECHSGRGSTEFEGRASRSEERPERWLLRSNKTAGSLLGPPATKSAHRACPRDALSPRHVHFVPLCRESERRSGDLPLLPGLKSGDKGGVPVPVARTGASPTVRALVTSVARCRVPV